MAATKISPEQANYHAEILSNRVKKRFEHLHKKFKRQNIECFRLYDWDIPEVRAVVDWYGGHLVVAEYERTQTGPQWLPQMAEAVSKILNVPMEKVHIKRRHTNISDGPRYSKINSKNERFTVSERDLKFWINLDDFLDTGLYSDHRDTRILFREAAKDKDVLNLYAYTGAFTCAAAAGGANSSTTVDRSATYINWAKENLELNKLMGPQHAFVQSDVTKFLADAFRNRIRFSLAIVDPPSFFKDQNDKVSFDIDQDHPQLLQNVLRVMASGAEIFFSTNHQRFVPRMEGLKAKSIREITPATIPEDYRNKKIHRCWRITAL